MSHEELTKITQTCGNEDYAAQIESLRELCCSCGEKAADAIEALLKERDQTCGNCKHWTRYPPPSRGTLASQDPDWEKQGECSALSCFVDCCGCGGGFDPKEDFSCNKWEPKP